jgi:hypothetical protein
MCSEALAALRGVPRVGSSVVPKSISRCRLSVSEYTNDSRKQSPNPT